MIALITGITVNIVHMGKTIAQKGAHVVKDGKRHKDVMLLLLGIPPKLILSSISHDFYHALQHICKSAACARS